MEKRAMHEVKHGQLLAVNDPELMWGWGTPAGKQRARRRAELISRGAALGDGILSLEIGCGTGMFTEMFAKTGARIVAVDISNDLLRHALARNLPSGRIVFLNRRFEECELEGPFDAIIGSSVLHHLDLKEALPKILKLLKPGGVISFAEPNMLNPQVFMERKARRCFSYISPDETAFVRWMLRRQLLQVGFSHVEITPFDWLHPAVPRRLIKAISVFGNMLENIPLLREFSGSLLIRAAHPILRLQAD